MHHVINKTEYKKVISRTSKIVRNFERVVGFKLTDYREWSLGLKEHLEKRRLSLMETVKACEASCDELLTGIALEMSNQSSESQRAYIAHRALLKNDLGLPPDHPLCVINGWAKCSAIAAEDLLVEHIRDYLAMKEALEMAESAVYAKFEHLFDAHLDSTIVAKALDEVITSAGEDVVISRAVEILKDRGLSLPGSLLDAISSNPELLPA